MADLSSEDQDARLSSVLCLLKCESVKGENQFTSYQDLEGGGEGGVA